MLGASVCEDLGFSNIIGFLNENSSRYSELLLYQNPCR